MAKYIEFLLISDKGKVSPKKYGYHIIPIYEMKLDYSKKEKWIDDNINGRWSWFAFHKGISFCFLEEIDAMAFKLRFR